MSSLKVPQGSRKALILYDYHILCWGDSILSISYALFNYQEPIILSHLAYQNSCTFYDLRKQWISKRSDIFIAIWGVVLTICDGKVLLMFVRNLYYIGERCALEEIWWGWWERSMDSFVILHFLMERSVIFEYFLLIKEGQRNLFVWMVILDL